VSNGPFLWQTGNGLVVDNMLMAHGRMPFTGREKFWSVCHKPDPFHVMVATYDDEKSVVHSVFVDARVQKIYGGTNEIMKILIAQSLCAIH
jgi:alkylation response protein AidB-like acyl-CoA dehydrogenase